MTSEGAPKGAVYEALEDQTGGLSTKRVITTFFAGLVAVGYLGNLIFDLTVEKWMFEAVTNAMMVGTIAILGEKFSPLVK